MPRQRTALLIATDTFQDDSFARLRSVGVDSSGLADVLRDPGVGGFSGVTVLLNEPAQVLREEIQSFLSAKGPDDFALLYFSGHGLKDDNGEFYFIATDTKRKLLHASGIGAGFLHRLTEASSAHSVFMAIDCCFSGAYPRGFVHRSGEQVDVGELLQGRGHAVLTASNAIEYAFEGDSSTTLQPSASVFTGAVIQGLRTGLADVDRDGLVSAEDLHRYVGERIKASKVRQTPKLFSLIDGPIIVARNPFHRTAPAGRVVRSGAPENRPDTTVLGALGQGFGVLVGVAELPDLCRNLMEAVVDAVVSDDALLVAALEILNAAERLPGGVGLINAGRSLLDTVRDLNNDTELARAATLIADSVLQLSLHAGVRPAALKVGTALTDALAGLRKLATDPATPGRLRPLVENLRSCGATMRELLDYQPSPPPTDPKSSSPPELRVLLRTLTTDLRQLRHTIIDLREDPAIAMILRRYAAVFAAGSTGDSRPPGALVTQVYLLSGALPAVTDALVSSPVSPVDALVTAANDELANWDVETPAFERGLRSGLVTLTDTTRALLAELRDLTDPDTQQKLAAEIDEAATTWDQAWPDLVELVEEMVSGLAEFADWIRNGFGVAKAEPAAAE